MSVCVCEEREINANDTLQANSKYLILRCHQARTKFWDRHNHQCYEQNSPSRLAPTKSRNLG